MTDFKNKVIYQIYPKSFKDTNHDGIGDLKGITQSLDYLNDLGVDYLWLTPFVVSPQRDNGYDIADYYHINPMYGTDEDLDELINEANKRDIGLMMDMVFNHTSTDHEWFQKALQGDPYYQDFYIFKDSKDIPNNWVSKFGGPAWNYAPELKKWYLCLFDKTQADLNWDNPHVREELKNVIRFWKERGIKGFRFDVINLISKGSYDNDYEGDGRRYYTDGPHVHEYIHELVHDTGIKDMITVGEMSSTSLEDCIKYSNREREELKMTFSFHHLKVDYKDNKKWELMDPDYKKLKELFKNWQLGMQAGHGWNALFWCNHDQPRIVSRFGDEGKYWKESAKMLATMIHMMQGTPYIYQGEELGMLNSHYEDISEYRDVESLNYYKILLEEGHTREEALHILSARSRDNSRSAMQWDDSTYAGFSDHEPWITMPHTDKHINVKEEINDKDSILNYYKQLVELRHELPVISEGTISFLYDDREDIMSYQRQYEDDELVVICNMWNQDTTVTLEDCYLSYTTLLSNYPITVEKTLKLPPYATIVLRK